VDGARNRREIPRLADLKARRFRSGTENSSG
jgi:hypothetical protein